MSCLHPFLFFPGFFFEISSLYLNVDSNVSHSSLAVTCHIDARSYPRTFASFVPATRCNDFYDNAFKLKQCSCVGQQRKFNEKSHT